MKEYYEWNENGRRKRKEPNKSAKKATIRESKHKQIADWFMVEIWKKGPLYTFGSFTL